MLKQLRYFFTLMLLAVASVGFAGSITFGELGLENSVQYTDPFDGGDFTVTFAGGGNDGKYYTTGEGIRVYGNGTMTITAKTGTITEITITYSGTYKPTATDDVVTIGTYNAETGVWTGSANEVVFTRPSGSGHWRVQKIEVTVAGGVTKEAAELSFGENTAFVVEPNADFEAPELDNPNELEVTYSSSDDDIALVDEETGFVVIGSKEGTATITATSEETDDFYAGSASYTITVKDPNAKGTENNPYTVAEALEVIDGLANNGYSDFVYVKGIISNIKSIDVSQYERAQYYISADGSTNNQLYVYNGYYLDNVAFTANDQIKVGDEVVIYGKLQKYVRNNAVTPEVAQDNYIVSIVNSGKPSAELAFEPTELTVELGDDFTAPTLNNPYNVAVTYTSSDENVAEVDTDGSLTIIGAGTATITATFAGDDNYAAGEASYTLTVVDPDAPGASIDNPYTVEEAIAFIETLGTNTSGEVYVKGIISQIDEVSTEHGNATYWISDDGETTVQMEVYRGKYLDNADFTDAGQIAVGDEVIVYGKLKSYNGTPEFNQGNYLVYLDHTDAPVLEDAGLAYDVETFTATIGEENEFPVLANPNELPVTYTSSNEDVATIDADGNITLVAAGETTITATSEETSEFEAGEASYVLTVEEKPEPIEPGTDKYELVTDASTLAADDEILIAYVNTDEEVIALAMGATQATNNRPAVEVVYNDDATLTPDATAQVIKLEGDEEGWYFNVGDGYLYAASSSKNIMKTQAEADENAKATIEIAENGDATIIFQGEFTRNHMRYNSNNGNPIFSCYAESSTVVTLPRIYRKVAEVEGETVPVTISSAEWATLYYSDKAFEIPEGVTAKIVVAIDDNDVIDFEDLNGIIPAGTAVALNGPQGTYDFKVVNDETVAPANNLLRGFDIPHLTEGGDIYYKLTVKNDKVGFYWGEENGDAFETGAHKAYLALSAEEANGVKFFVLGTAGDLVSEDGGFVDGINEVTASDSKKEYFNLNGTRVNSLRKGIYIVGGKKVVIK